MAELTTPFLLAGASLEPNASLSDWLRSVHIQPRWLDEVVVVSPYVSLRSTGLAEAKPNLLTYRWPGWKQSQHFLLQQACREIGCGERRLILLLSESEAVTTALVLAAPAAIGIYNQIPLAYLDAWFALHIENTGASLFDALSEPLKKAEKKPQQLHTLFLTAGRMKKPVKSGTDYASATWTKPTSEPANAISACLDVLNTLTSSGKKNGLAVEVDDSPNLYGVWIERL